MRFWERLSSVDRRILYLLLSLSVALPLILKPRTKVRVSEPVRQAYEAVDKLPAGSVMMISIDYDPSSAPEVQPMLIALLHHAFRNNVKVIVTGQLPLGLPLAGIALTQVAPLENKVYGKDYVNLGYRPGYTALIVGIGRYILDYIYVEYKAVPIDSFEFLRSVHTYRDIGLLVVRAHQIRGIIGGLQGASEYEALVEKPGSATLGMPAQSAAHGLIILLLVIGNLGYIVSRRKAKK
jgi:hypothetical protein